MRLALYQPDIPQNTGSMLRLAACFGLGVDIIEPCGFVFDNKKLRRSGMDYLDLIDLQRHTSWQAFQEKRGASTTKGRLLLLTTKASQCYSEFEYASDDILLMGRESAGVPEDVAAAADVRLKIPLHPAARSLNVAMAAAIVTAEAQRQLGFPAARIS